MSGRSREERTSMRRHPAGSALRPRLEAVKDYDTRLFSGQVWEWLVVNEHLSDDALALEASRRFHWSQGRAHACVRAYREASK